MSAIPWTVARWAPLSVDFSRQEYWSGLPFPPPQNYHERGINAYESVSLTLKWVYQRKYHTFTVKQT